MRFPILSGEGSLTDRSDTGRFFTCAANVDELLQNIEPERGSLGGAGCGDEQPQQFRDPGSQVIQVDRLGVDQGNTYVAEVDSQQAAWISLQVIGGWGGKVAFNRSRKINRIGRPAEGEIEGLELFLQFRNSLDWVLNGAIRVGGYGCGLLAGRVILGLGDDGLPESGFPPEAVGHIDGIHIEDQGQAQPDQKGGELGFALVGA